MFVAFTPTVSVTNGRRETVSDASVPARTSLLRRFAEGAMLASAPMSSTNLRSKGVTLCEGATPLRSCGPSKWAAPYDVLSGRPIAPVLPARKRLNVVRVCVMSQKILYLLE